MFTQAGFRQDYHVIASARVSRVDSLDPVDGYLVRWPGGEYAWASRTQICWSHQVVVHELGTIRPGETVPRDAAAGWRTRPEWSESCQTALPGTGPQARQEAL